MQNAENHGSSKASEASGKAAEFWTRRPLGPIQGPYEKFEILKLAAAGMLSREDEVSVDKVSWRNAGGIKGLFAASGNSNELPPIQDRVGYQDGKHGPVAISEPKDLANSPPTLQDASGTGQKSTDEKFCLECGTIIRANAEICPKCGVRQMAPPPQLIAESRPLPLLLPHDSRACNSCGYQGPMKTYLRNYSSAQLIAVILLLFYVIPGIIYIIMYWGKFRCPVCSKVGSNALMTGTASAAFVGKSISGPKPVNWRNIGIVVASILSLQVISSLRNREYQRPVTSGSSGASGESSYGSPGKKRIEAEIARTRSEGLRPEVLADQERFATGALNAIACIEGTSSCSTYQVEQYLKGLPIGWVEAALGPPISEQQLSAGHFYYWNFSLNEGGRQRSCKLQLEYGSECRAGVNGGYGACKFNFYC